MSLKIERNYFSKHHPLSCVLQMLYALYKEGPEILNIVQIQVVQFVWWFMDFFTNGYRRQKI